MASHSRIVSLDEITEIHRVRVSCPCFLVDKGAKSVRYNSTHRFPQPMTIPKHSHTRQERGGWNVVESSTGGCGAYFVRIDGWGAGKAYVRAHVLSILRADRTALSALALHLSHICLSILVLCSRPFGHVGR